MPHPPPFPPAMPSPPSPPPSPPAPPPPLIVDFDPELPYAIVEIAPFDDLYCSENPGGKCTVYGTLAVQSHVGGIYAYGYLSGLEKSVTAGWHVHEGYECDDIDMIKGHYFEKGSFDPWVDAKYTSDANGVAEVAQQVAGFTLTDAYPVAGRALVIHDQFGRMRGCGIIRLSNAEVVQLGDYPGYTGGREVRGLLAVEDAEGGLRTHGTIVGLEPSQTGGWHIHSGYSCAETSAVGGHYYDAAPDPWNIGNTFYEADANGAAQIDKTMPSFSMHLRDVLPVYGRTVVVHLASDSKVKPACGVIGGAVGVTAAVAFTEQFPAYAGDYSSVRAAAHVTESDGTLTITAVMTGLGADMTGGWHVHSGFSCDDAGGHYFEGLDDDPWCSSCTTWTSDSTGVATVTWSSSDFSLTGVRPVSGRTFVVHDKDGKKAACGVIEPSTMQVTSLGAYPGYTGGRMVGGLVGIADRSDGVQIEGLITGLESSVTGGWHIHSGYSCSETPAGLTAGAVGGHYFDPDDPNGDPWTVLTTHPLGGTFYESDGSGVARISKTMPGFSLYGEWPVYGRTVVVHESNPAVKPACGVIGVGATSYEALMPSMVKYSVCPAGPCQTLTVNGMLKFSSVGSTLTVSGVLTGLEPSTSGGWHVHSGFSCTDTDGAGGHYYDGLGSDPWCSDCVKWYSDAKGVAVVSLTMEDFTLDPAGPRYVGGRTVVVHASAGTKVACGVIEPLAGAEVVTMGAFPGYAGSETVRGILLKRDAKSSQAYSDDVPYTHAIAVTGILTGLPPSEQGSVHVHNGVTCDPGFGS